MYLFQCFGRAAARTKKAARTYGAGCFFCGLRRAIRGSLRSYLMRYAHFGTARKRAAATIPLAEKNYAQKYSMSYIFVHSF
jgi:hypothetical protein